MIQVAIWEGYIIKYKATFRDKLGYKPIGQIPNYRNIQKLHPSPDSMGECNYQTGRRPAYRSRAEREIGEFLDSRHIPFIYEKPTAVMDAGQFRTWYPDFALQCGPLIEYFGVTGDRHYLEGARHKLRVYQENQFDVIPLYPADVVTQWPDNLLRRIESVMEGRLRDIRK